MKKIYISVMAFLLLFQASAQILLRYDLEKGKNYPSVLEVNQTIRQTVMGASQNVETGQIMEMDMLVEDVEEGITTMAISYTRIAIEQTTPMGETRYDSDSAKGEVPPAASGFAALVDKGFVVSFDNQGEIRRVAGLDAMIESMVDGMNIEDAAQKEQAMQLVKDQFDEDALASQLQNSLAIYPEEEINIGDSWTMNQSITTPFPMLVVSNYMLTDYDENYAYVSVNSSIKTGETSTMQNAGMTMNIELSGEQSGSLKVERKSGMITTSDIRQNASGNITITSPQEMSWPIELDTQVKVTGDF